MSDSVSTSIRRLSYLNKIKANPSFRTTERKTEKLEKLKKGKVEWITENSTYITMAIVKLSEVSGVILKI